MKREKLSFRGCVICAALAAVLAFLFGPWLSISGKASAPIGKRDEVRPTPAPATTTPKKTNSTKTQPKRTTTRSTQLTKPRQAPNIEMVLIPAGTFTMGSPDSEAERTSDERPQHQVTVPKFYMGKFEVKQAQYKAVMGSNPSYFKGDNLPVERVSWKDAVEFCRRLSQITGREYRLPTESEWEYACRAGTTGEYAGNLDSIAWYLSNSGFQTHAVGTKQPNAWGLHDMHGNVWEWCEDRYHDSYNGAPTDGSAWEGSGVQLRVLRGGSWNYNANILRSANRLRIMPGLRYNYYGFRVVAVSP